jgi:arylsulfatase A-like enzyme
LRGSKLSLYEGGNRLPLIVWWPGKAPAGKLNESTVMSGVDFLPSLCKIAGAKIPAAVAEELDGQDLSSAFTGGTPTRSKPIFWEYGRNETSFAYPQVKRDRSPNVAVRDGDWKLLVNADGSDAQLYDLASDPKEKSNVAEKNSAVVQRLTALALDWRNSLPTTAAHNL